MNFMPRNEIYTGSDIITRVLPMTTKRVFVYQPARDWRHEVVQKLNELTSLHRGWDGYNAIPVRFDTANFALQMLEQVCAEDAPAPQIVPGTNGDLQIEWHTFNGDLELHVRSPYRILAWRANPSTGSNGEERVLTNEFTEVAQWVRDLTEPSVAEATPA